MTQVALDWGAILPDIPEVSASQDLIPPGTYTCSVEKAEAGQSQAGNPKIELTLKVIDGEHTNRRVWGRINFATTSKDSMAITVAQLGEFGITRQWLATNNPSTEQIGAKMVGQPISVRVTHREYQGKMYYNVTGYTRAKANGAATATSQSQQPQQPQQSQMGAAAHWDATGSSVPF